MTQFLLVAIENLQEKCGSIYDELTCVNTVSEQCREKSVGKKKTCLSFVVFFNKDLFNHYIALTHD
jgi:hypothetical protein